MDAHLHGPLNCARRISGAFPFEFKMEDDELPTEQIFDRFGSDPRQVPILIPYEYWLLLIDPLRSYPYGVQYGVHWFLSQNLCADDPPFYFYETQHKKPVQVRIFKR